MNLTVRYNTNLKLPHKKEHVSARTIISSCFRALVLVTENVKLVRYQSTQLRPNCCNWGHLLALTQFLSLVHLDFALYIFVHELNNLVWDLSKHRGMILCL